MFDQRFQILLSKDQRRRLEDAAKARGTSIAALIREAIEGHLGSVSREEKIRAAEEIAAMQTGVELTPEEINAIVDEGLERTLRLMRDSAG